MGMLSWRLYRFSSQLYIFLLIFCSFGQKTFYFEVFIFEFMEFNWFISILIETVHARTHKHMSKQTVSQI